MDVGIICIGKLKEEYWRAACAEYAKRLSAFCRFSIIELAEARLPKDPAPGDIRRALSEEGARILERCPSNAWIAALCIEGDLLTSEKLAERMASADFCVSLLVSIITLLFAGAFTRTSFYAA